MSYRVHTLLIQRSMAKRSSKSVNTSPRTFRTKLLLIIGIAMAVAATGRAIVDIASDGRRTEGELISQAAAAARQGAKSVTTAVWELNRDQAVQILDGLALNPDLRTAVVTDQVGRVFARVGRKDDDSNPAISATADIIHEKAGEPRRLGTLIVTLSRDRAVAQRDAAIVSAATGAVVEFALVFLAACFAVYLITKPMEAITAAMLGVARGRTDSPTPYVERRDQLGALAQAVEAFRFEIGRRMGVEEDLRVVHSQLEERIDERTAALRVLNEQLGREARERELAEQRLIDAINSIPDGFVLFDPDDRLVLCNNRYKAIYVNTNTIGELRGKTFEEISRSVADGYVFDCDTPEAAGAWLNRRIAHHRNSPVEPFILHLADGRWIQINERRTKESGYVSVCVDVTEQKQMVLALQQSEAKFRGLLAASPDALLAVDSQGTISIANRQTESLFGYRQDELIGLPLQSLIPEHFRRVHGSLVARYFTTSSEPSMGGDLGLFALRKNGSEFPVEISFSPYTTDGEALVLAAVRDITARKEAEIALRQAQKMEALGTLAGGIAHDLNNTLVPIVGLTQLTADALPEGSAERDNLNDVLGAALRAGDLVRQILTFSRAEKQSLASVDLAATVRESLRLLRSALPPTIALKLELPNQPVPILCNETQLHQVMMNLCSNAAQAVAGKRGGKITVRLDAEHPAPKHCQNGSDHPGHYAKLSVIDNGSGMDTETQERIFEPFFTTKGVGEGTGLGLAVVHGVVHAHHGHITVASERGQGARFDVFLPIIQA